MGSQLESATYKSSVRRQLRTRTSGLLFIFILVIRVFLSPSLFLSFITASHSASGDRELSEKNLVILQRDLGELEIKKHNILQLDLRELELKKNNDKQLDLRELELQKHNDKTRTFQEGELAENELKISDREQENEKQEERTPS